MNDLDRNHLPTIMLSKSGSVANAFISDIRTALSCQFTCVTEDDFRPSTAHLHPHDSWTHQFLHTRSATVMIVILTGHERDDFGRPNISVGQNIEVFDALGRGMPAVWIGATDGGHEIATKWQSIMARNHPCRVSHQLDARQDRDRCLADLLSLCERLSEIPKPKLPDVFEPGHPQRVEYHVCETRPKGWGFKDLSEQLFRPVMRVRYGDHIISSPYQQALKTLRHEHDVKLDIVEPETGLIAGEVVPVTEGVGQFHVQWRRYEETPVTEDQWPWGTEILHWDFSSGAYPLF